MVFCSCSEKNRVIISGNFKNAENRMLHLALVTTSGMEIIDSVRLRKGNFEFNISTEDEKYSEMKLSPLMFNIYFSEDNGLFTMAKEGDHLVFNADATDLSGTYTVTGGEEAVLMHQLDSALLTFIKPVNDLFEIYEKNIESDSVRADIESKYVVLLDNHRKYLENFIKEHPYNMSAYSAFFQSYNRRKFFDDTNDIDILRNINSHLVEKYPESQYVKSMMHLVNMIEKSNIKTQTNNQ